MSSLFSRAGIAHFDQHTRKCPYLTFTVGSGGLRRLAVKIWSHDQGYSSDSSHSGNRFSNSHTWFALGAIQGSAEADEVPDDELFEFQRNARALSAVQCHYNEWVIGLPASEEDEDSYIQFWLESLADAEGFKIGIFPLAQYPGWVNTVWKMEVEVTCGSTVDSPLPALHVGVDFDDNEHTIHSKRGIRHSVSTTHLSEDEITTIGHESIELTLQDDPHHSNQLEDVGTWLLERFRISHSLPTLELAKRFLRLVVENTPYGHPRQARRSINFALSLGLGHEFTDSKSITDLTRAIDILTVALHTELTSCSAQGGIDRGLVLNNLGNFLGRRFDYTISLQDLDQAINYLEMVIEITPADHPDRGGRLNNLAAWLTRRLRYKSQISDIDRAIDHTDEAIKRISVYHPKYAGWLINLSNRLGARFERTGSIADIHRAIQAAETAVEITPHVHPQRPNRLNSLGELLRVRFERTHTMKDITRAIQIVNEGIDATPQTHPMLEALLLSNLGSCFGRLFGRSGSLDDLNRSIEALSKSLGKTPKDHFDSIIRLDNLAIQLSLRHTRTGSMADIDRAVSSLQAALDLTPSDHSYRGVLLSNLSLCLGTRYYRTKSVNDINSAIDALDEAIENVSEGHPNHEKFLFNVGAWLGVRNLGFGSDEDLDRAIASLTKALVNTPEDHPDRAMQLNNLGKWLTVRSKRSTSMADLNLAAETLKRAASTIPADHYDRINVFKNLGDCYHLRFLRTGSADDFQSQLTYCLQGWHCENSSPSTRIQLAQIAAQLLGIQSRWNDANDMLKGAIILMPTLSPRALKRTDQQHMLADASGIASEAAAAALNAGEPPEECLRLLELGRGVMASLLLETRTEITDLEQSFPDLATRFESLRDELDAPLNLEMTRISVDHDDLSSWETQAQRRRELDISFKEVIEEIRTKTEFENFLLPPEVQDLLGAASSGPIVVLNANHWRCDAFLITSNDIQLVSLPLLADAIEGTMEVSSSMLEKLWDNAARPVLEQLGFCKRPEGDNLPRLFWILTGSLSRLPFHAAGYHYEDSSDTVLDCVVSSYGTSIKALLQSRRSSTLKIGRNASREACLVSMQTTPPHGGFSPSNLEFAEEEIQMLDSLLYPCVATSLLSQPSKETVLHQIEGCTAFHFAGHGNTPWIRRRAAYFSTTGLMIR